MIKKILSLMIQMSILFIGTTALVASPGLGAES